MEQNKRTPFQQALLDATLESYADIPAEAEIDADFSQQFLQKSDTLLKNARKGKPQRTGKNLRRILLVAAIISVLIAMAVMSAAQRIYLFQYTITDYGRYYEFKYTDTVPPDAPDHLETFYRPTYIPEGYELEDSIGNDNAGVQYNWCNAEGAHIVYAQVTIREDHVFLRLHKNTKIPTTIDGILIDGYDVLRIVSDIGTQYYWIDGEYFHYLAMDPGIPQEEQMKIFHSIAVDKSPVLTQL